MGIAEQLKSIREKCVTRKVSESLLSKHKSEPNVVYYDRVERAVGVFRDLHRDCYAKNEKYFKYFAGSGSQGFRRDRLTESENAKLSKRIKHFLSVLAPYVEHEHCEVLIDWMIRSYRVDGNEFESLLSTRITNRERFEEFSSRMKKMAAGGKKALEEILKYGYTQESVGRALGKSVAFSSCVLDTIANLSLDKEGAQYMAIFEGIVQRMFEKTEAEEGVVSMWVAALFEVKNRVEREKEMEIEMGRLNKRIKMSDKVDAKIDAKIDHEVGGEGESEQHRERISRCVDEMLICIGRSTVLIDEIAEKIGAIEKRREEEENPKIDQTDSVTEKKHVGKAPFSVLYTHYRRSGECKDLKEKYLREFVEELSREVELSYRLKNGKNGEVTENREDFWIGFDGFAKLVMELVEKSSRDGVDILTRSREALDLVSSSSVWTKMVRKCPVIGVLKGLEEGNKKKIFTKKNLKLVSEILPNAEIEKKLFKLAKTKTDADLLSKHLLDRISREVLAEEMEKAESWSDVSPYVREGTLSLIARNMNSETLVREFHHYLDASEALGVYEKVSDRLAQEEKDALKTALDERIKRKTHTRNSIIMCSALAEDFSVPSRDMEPLISGALKLPKDSRKTGVKAVLEVLARRKDRISRAALFSIADKLSPEQIDAALSLLYFNALVSLDVEDFDVNKFAREILSKSRSGIKKMAETARAEEKQLVLSLVQKHAEKLSEETLLALQEQSPAMYAPILIQKFSQMSQKGKETVVSTAVEEKSKGNGALLSALAHAVSFAQILPLIPKNTKYSVSLALDAIAEERAPVSLFSLDLLIAARRMHVPEKDAQRWEAHVLSQPGAPQLLSQKLADRKDASIVTTLIGRYLKQGRSSTLLLESLVKNGIFDAPVIFRVLEHSPSQKSKVALLDMVLNTAPEKGLDVVREVLKDGKSPQIREYVQRTLPRTVPAVLQFKNASPKEIAHVIANIIRREGDVMAPHAAQIVDLAKATRQIGLVRSLSRISPFNILRALAHTKTDYQILRRYVRFRTEKHALESEEEEQLLSHHIDRVAPGAVAHSLLEMFSVMEKPKAIWGPLLRKSGGVTGQLLATVLYMVKRDEKGACTQSLSAIYTKLEDLLMSELESPSASFFALVGVMKRYYRAEKGTLAKSEEITRKAVRRLESESSMQKIEREALKKDMQGGKVMEERLADGRLAGGRLAGGRLAGGKLAGDRLKDMKLANGKFAETVSNPKSSKRREHKRVFRGATSVLSALFSSRTRTSPAEAEEMNLALLKRVAAKDADVRLFSVLKAIYKENRAFLPRILAQSAPYFSVLLESRVEAVRKRAARLMQSIEKSTGENPYAYIN